MIYITVKQPPMHHQMTIEEYLFNSEDTPCLITDNRTNTRTYERERVTEAFSKEYNIDALIAILEAFNKSNEYLRNKPREELYHSYFIPKRKGGKRRIDEPLPELMEALRNLKMIIEERFTGYDHHGALYHTAAHAYINGRSTTLVAQKHQANASKWVAKFDLSNFFGSITKTFLMNQMRIIWPFSEICQTERGFTALSDAFELAFYNGGLPQGTPISPMLTNIIMIPIDYKLSNALRDYHGNEYVYTRYADDFQISSKYGFDVKTIESLIISTLQEFNAPLRLKKEKTEYLSVNHGVWMLGVMFNKDNKLTIGHKNKKMYQAMLSNYVKDRLKGITWLKADIQTLEGYRSYYRMIEPENIDGIVKHMGEKYGVDIIAMIKADLKS